MLKNHNNVTKVSRKLKYWTHNVADIGADIVCKAFDEYCAVDRQPKENPYPLSEKDRKYVDAKVKAHHFMSERYH